MYSRIDEVPALRVTRSSVDAADYNRIRLALLRLGEPLRLSLRGLRDLDVLLGREAWICVDRTLNDLPVIAWTRFAIAGRSDLQAPVLCELRCYHAQAGMILAPVREEIAVQLAERLDIPRGGTVSPLGRPD